VGDQAGKLSQGQYAVAVGVVAGAISQGTNSVAVGWQSGYTSQSTNAVAIGNAAGYSSQGQYAVAIGGDGAGNSSQGNEAVAIGRVAGNSSQGANSVAIGAGAGNVTQGTLAVALGTNAGNSLQGRNAVAIGYAAGQNSQHASSIVISAIGSAAQSAGVNTCVIAPIRNGAGGFVLNYSTPSGEITYTTSSRSTKNTIEPLVTDTATVYQLAPKTFIYNTDPQSGTHVGYIAEEVYEVNPAFATYCELNGPPVAINYNTVQVYMLEEMKKLRAEVDALKAQLAPASQ